MKEKQKDGRKGRRKNMEKRRKPVVNEQCSQTLSSLLNTQTGEKFRNVRLSILQHVITPP
jgi:hypothetical protein